MPDAQRQDLNTRYMITTRRSTRTSISSNGFSSPTLWWLEWKLFMTSVSSELALPLYLDQSDMNLTSPQFLSGGLISSHNWSRALAAARRSRHHPQRIESKLRMCRDACGGSHHEQQRDVDECPQSLQGIELRPRYICDLFRLAFQLFLIERKAVAIDRNTVIIKRSAMAV